MKTRRSGIILGLIGLMVSGAAALLPLVAESRESREPREIVLVARKMAFYRDGTGSPNPTLQLQPGERLKITLVNDDPGINHDFALPSLSEGTGAVRGRGKISMMLQAPDKPGALEYVCSLHGSMMKGTVEVVTAPRAKAQ